MLRATRVLPAGSVERGCVADTLILSFEQRRAARGAFVGVKGTRVEIALAPPVHLRAGDGLLLEDGSVVEIVAEPESLLEARASDLPSLARLAWHLGDRHIPAEILPNRVRVRRDAAVESLLARLGARIVAIEAPFEPEGGAYASAPNYHEDRHHGAHNHRHDRPHGHDHDHAAPGHSARHTGR